MYIKIPTYIIKTKVYNDRYLLLFNAKTIDLNVACYLQPYHDIYNYIFLIPTFPPDWKLCG